MASEQTSAAAVANFFIDRGRAEPSVPPVDQMKLQKLIFYAHAWSLALKDRPLFEENFEAWPWGPVVRDIYYQTAQYGRRPIENYIKRLSIEPGKTLLTGAHFVTPKIEDDEIRNFLDSVWSSHKNFTGVQLSNATHGENEPWTIMLKEYGSLDHKPTMPNDLIKKAFKAKIAEAA